MDGSQLQRLGVPGVQRWYTIRYSFQAIHRRAFIRTIHLLDQFLDPETRKHDDGQKSTCVHWIQKYLDDSNTRSAAIIFRGMPITVSLNTA